VPTRTFGHPGKKRLSELVLVPWAVVEGERRHVESGGVESQTAVTDEEVQERLTHLVYAEE
jgi:hypothetical protein